MIAGEDFRHRIQRAGPDVAVDDAEGGQRQGGEARAGRPAGRLMTAHDCSLRVAAFSVSRFLHLSCCTGLTIF